MPLLVGGDLLQDHDDMPRLANRQMVVQRKDVPINRLVTRMWTMTKVLHAIREVQERRTALQCGTTWHAVWGPGVVRLRDSTSRGRQSYVPSFTMKVIKLRNPSHVQPGELFVVDVESAIAHVRDQAAAEQ